MMQEHLCCNKNELNTKKKVSIAHYSTNLHKKTVSKARFFFVCNWSESNRVDRQSMEVNG